MNPLEFSFSVSADHPSLAGHFPQHPIVPGVLILDHVLSNLQRATGRRVICLRQVKFTTAMRPQEQAHVRCEVDFERASFRVTAERDGVVMTIAAGVLTLESSREPCA